MPTDNNPRPLTPAPGLPPMTWKVRARSRLRENPWGVSVKMVAAVNALAHYLLGAQLPALRVVLTIPIFYELWWAMLLACSVLGLAGYWYRSARLEVAALSFLAGATSVYWASVSLFYRNWLIAPFLVAVVLGALVRIWVVLTAPRRMVVP